MLTWEIVMASKLARRVTVVVCLGFGLGNTIAARSDEKSDAAKPLYTVSRETTVVTGPLLPNGHLDTAGAINAALSKGVTAENNACVVLYQALGPRPEGDDMPDAFFELLGTPRPPADGQYLVDITKFARENKVSLESEELYQQQNTAGTRPWTSSEFPAIAGWLKANSRPLELVAQAGRRTRYYSPLVTDLGQSDRAPLIAVLLPGVQKSRSIARALCARAMLHAGEGRPQQAWADLLTTHRLARHIAQGPTLIEGLVGIAIEQMAVALHAALIDKHPPSAELAARYRSQYESLPKFPDMADKIALSERLMLIDSIIVLSKADQQFAELLDVEEGVGAVVEIVKLIGADQVDWDTVLKQGNSWYDRLDAAFRLPTHPQRTKKLAQVMAEVEELKMTDSDRLKRFKQLQAAGQRTALSELLADTLIQSFLPALDAVALAETRCRQREQNTRLAMALAAHQADHGAYPGKLSELAPKYIPKVPQDLYLEIPLRYQVTSDGYLLYGVGRNLKDDNGRWYSDDPQGDDIRVKVPYQPED